MSPTFARHNTTNSHVFQCLSPGTECNSQNFAAKNWDPRNAHKTDLHATTRLNSRNRAKVKNKTQKSPSATHFCKVLLRQVTTKHQPHFLNPEPYASPTPCEISTASPPSPKALRRSQHDDKHRAHKSVRHAQGRPECGRSAQRRQWGACSRKPAVLNPQPLRSHPADMNTRPNNVRRAYSVARTQYAPSFARVVPRATQDFPSIWKRLGAKQPSSALKNRVSDRDAIRGQLFDSLPNPVKQRNRRGQGGEAKMKELVPFETQTTYKINSRPLRHQVEWARNLWLKADSRKLTAIPKQKDPVSPARVLTGSLVRGRANHAEALNGLVEHRREAGPSSAAITLPGGVKRAGSRDG
jgi:hypothetical protein